MRDRDALRSLEGAWRELAVARGNAFVTPEWFWTWMRHYGDSCEPLVVTVSDAQSRLVGLLPLVAGRDRRGIVRFAGSALGDYFHPVARAEDEVEVARRCGRLLATEGAILVAENVDAEASWWRELWAATGYGADPVTDRAAPLPAIGRDGRTWAEYLATRSRNLRSQLGRKRRALERDHEVLFRWDHEDVGEAIATLFRLHDMRWSAREGQSTLTSPAARRFHADFAALAKRRGWLRLVLLEVEHEPVAAWYGWLIGGRFAYYQAGFDPAWERESVGLILFSETIRMAFDEDAEEYGMLLGGEDFKLRFADRQRAAVTVMIAPRMRATRMLAITEARLRRAGRRLPKSSQAIARRGMRSLLRRMPLARRR